jgi:hypothetical protein
VRQKWSTNGVCESRLPANGANTNQWKCHNYLCGKRAIEKLTQYPHKNWEHPCQLSSKYFVIVSSIHTTTRSDDLSNCYFVSTLRLFLTQSSVDEKKAYFSGSLIWARDNLHRVNCSVSSCVVIFVNTVVDLFLLKGCLIVDIVIFCKTFYLDCLKL